MTADIGFTNDFSTANSRVSHTFHPYVSKSCYSQSIDILPNGISQYISFGKSNPQLNNLIMPADLVSGNVSLSGGYCQDLTRLSFNQALTAIGWCNIGRGTDKDALLAVLAQPGILENPTWEVTACVIKSQWIRSAVNFTASSSLFAITDDISKFNSSDAPLIKIQPAWAKNVTSRYLRLNSDEGDQTSETPGVDQAIMYMDTIMALGLSKTGPTTQYLYLTYPVPVYFWPKKLPFPSSGIYPLSELSDKQYTSMQDLLKQQRIDLRKFASVQIFYLNWTDPSSLAQFKVQHFVHGYGYDTSDTAVKLSLAVLATYALIVLIQLVYSLVRGRVGTSWDSIGEVVMLSLNSGRPTHMQGTSVGVETTGTFGKMMNVRINKSNSAEIVFDDDPNVEKAAFAQVEANKKYL